MFKGMEAHTLMGRYTEWFSSFIQHSDEKQRQGEIFSLLLERLKTAIPNFFTTSSSDSPIFIDLMCGPGKLTHNFKRAFQNIGINNIRAGGIDLQEDHIKQWKNLLEANDIIIKTDISASNLNILDCFKLTEKNKPIAILLSHGGYYLYQPAKTYENNSCKKVTNQPKLDNIVSLMHNNLHRNGIAVSMHKGRDWLDIPKKIFANIVESDTTAALKQSYNKQNIKYEVLSFECGLSIPPITNDIRSRLTAEKIECYDQMEEGDAKEIRKILEFLAHSPLEELKYNKVADQQLQSHFIDLNHQARTQYLSLIEWLIDKHNNIIPNYIELNVFVSSEHDIMLAEEIMNAVRKINQEMGRSVDKIKLLKAEQEAEKLFLFPNDTNTKATSLTLT